MSKNKHRALDMLQKCYRVCKDGIEFETENRARDQKTQKDEKLAFQKNQEENADLSKSVMNKIMNNS